MFSAVKYVFGSEIYFRQWNIFLATRRGNSKLVDSIGFSCTVKRKYILKITLCGDVVSVIRQHRGSVATVRKRGTTYTPGAGCIKLLTRI